MSLPSLFCRYFGGVRRILHVLEKNTNTTRKMDTWCAEKERILNMDLETKRKLLYNMKKYVILDDIPTWKEECANEHFAATQPPTELDREQFQEFFIDTSLNRIIANKVSIWKGDITELEIDAIVNAANSSLAGGGGVDGFIHRAAGRELKKECLHLKGCKTGDAKITGGYCLPAKYVIHTVGPQDKSHVMLASCYQSCFHLQRENKLKSIAFPCISTGVYGFPNRPAAHIALSTARKNLEDDIKKYDGSLDRVIFCVFLKEDMEIYQSVAQLYFPAE